MKTRVAFEPMKVTWTEAHSNVIDDRNGDLSSLTFSEDFYVT